MGAVFERVHTVTDFWDGPVAGVADLEGAAHYYERDWDESQDDADTYSLTPIDDETLALALEEWAIWRRWEAAFHEGRAAIDTHPALPGERARYEELQVRLAGRLRVDPDRAIRKRGEFQARDDPDLWMEVRWEDPAGAREPR